MMADSAVLVVRSLGMCFRCLNDYVALELPLYLVSREDSMVSFFAVSLSISFVSTRGSEAKRSEASVYGVTVSTVFR